jgi:hypothetical protein
VAALTASCAGQVEELSARGQRIDALSGCVRELEGVRDDLKAQVSKDGMEGLGHVKGKGVGCKIQS